MDNTNKNKLFLNIAFFALFFIIIFGAIFYLYRDRFIKNEEEKLTDIPVIDFGFNSPSEDLVETKEDDLDIVANKTSDQTVTPKAENIPVKSSVVVKETPKIDTTTKTIVATSTEPVVSSTTLNIIKSILPPESPTDYKDNGNGTITDNYTKLMWAKCTQGNTGKDCSGGSPSIKEWSKARNDCEALKLAGKTGWRLPTLKELEFIVDSNSFNPSINKTFFPNTLSEPYWTSIAPAQYSSSKFTVSFGDGTVYFKSEGNLAAIRCVRDNI